MPTDESLGVSRLGSSSVPTVLRADGFRFYVWSREANEPPHVHVDRAGSSAKVWLKPIGIAANSGYPGRELGIILALVRVHEAGLLEAWHEFFGTG